MAIEDALDDGEELEQLMMPFYVELARVAWGNAKRQGIVDGVFDLDNPFVQTILDQLAKRITNVAETSKEDVRILVGKQADEGWTTQELADALKVKFDEWSTTRTEMIAVTETATAYSLGSIAAWKDSGQVTGMEWQTTEGACDICGPLSGMVVKMGEEFAPGISSPGAHPMCRCAIAPRID